MSWINLSETEKHGPIGIEVPDEEPWGKTFGELAAAVVPAVLANCQPTVGMAKHLVCFSTSNHPMVNDTDETSYPKIRGARASCHIDSLENPKIAGPVLSVVSRQAIIENIALGYAGEITALKYILHEIHEMDEAFRDKEELRRHLGEPDVRNPLYSQKPIEVTANRLAMDDLFEHLGPEYESAVTKQYLHLPGMPIFDHEIDQDSAAKRFADDVQKSAELAEMKFDRKPVRLPRGTIVSNVTKDGRYERLEIPLETMATQVVDISTAMAAHKDRLVRFPTSAAELLDKGV